MLYFYLKISLKSSKKPILIQAFLQIQKHLYFNQKNRSFKTLIYSFMFF